MNHLALAVLFCLVTPPVTTMRKFRYRHGRQQDPLLISGSVLQERLAQTQPGVVILGAGISISKKNNKKKKMKNIQSLDTGYLAPVIRKSLDTDNLPEKLIDNTLNINSYSTADDNNVKLGDGSSISNKNRMKKKDKDIQSLNRFELAPLNSVEKESKNDDSLDNSGRLGLISYRPDGSDSKMDPVAGDQEGGIIPGWCDPATELGGWLNYHPIRIWCSSRGFINHGLYGGHVVTKM